MLANLKFDLIKMNSKSTETGIIHDPIDSKNGFICKVRTSHERWKSLYPVDCSTEFDDLSYVMEVEQGIWECSAGNFHLDIRDSDHRIVDSGSLFNYITEYGTVLTETQYSKLVEVDNTVQILDEYGVADNIEQIKSYYRACIANPNQKFVISVMPVLKRTQPEFCGWRMHKWGEYIGIQNCSTEYLYDDPEVEELLCFHIYWVE